MNLSFTLMLSVDDHLSFSKLFTNVSFDYLHILVTTNHLKIKIMSHDFWSLFPLLELEASTPYLKNYP